MRSTTFDEIGSKKSALFLVNAKEEDLLPFVRLYFSWPFKVAALKDVLNDFTLFAEEKIFLINESEKFKKDEVELLKSITTPIFFIGKGMRSNFPLYAWIEEKGVVLDLSLEKKGEKEKRYVQLIMKMTAKFQKKISVESALKLFGQIGDNPLQLEQEIIKLVSFTEDKPQITNEDIAAISSFTKEESIWDFLEALLQRQKGRALTLGRRLLEEGYSIFPLLRQIRTQLQTEFQVALLMHTPDQITQRFPYMKGWVLDQHLNTARKYGIAGFKKALLVTEEIDLLSRGSIEDPELLLELLIAKL